MSNLGPKFGSVASSTGPAKKNYVITVAISGTGPGNRLTKTYQLPKAETVLELKRRVASAVGVAVSAVTLSYKEQPMEDGKLFTQYTQGESKIIFQGKVNKSLPKNKMKKVRSSP